MPNQYDELLSLTGRPATSMGVGALLAVVLASGCGSSRRSTDGPDGGRVPPTSEDGGHDTSEDAGGMSTLPVVEPSGNDCPDEWDDPDVACVDEGWFLLPRWSSMVEFVADGEPLQSPRQPVYIDAFLVDRLQVRVGDWQKAVEAGVVPAPPDDCGGVTDRRGDSSVPETSGWIAGVPDTAPDRPVVCITRMEATTFCNHVGGRLPTLAEHQKAALGPFPSRRRFPWGDEPPGMVPAGLEDRDGARGFADLDWDFVFERAEAPVLSAAGSHPLGASQFGLLDLAGGAAEYLADCEIDLRGFSREPRYGRTIDPIVRPLAADDLRCPATDGASPMGSLIAASNWGSVGPLSHALATSVVVLRSQTRFTDLPADPPLASELLGSPTMADSSPANGGNDDRSWRVGVRCAYDID